MGRVKKAASSSASSVDANDNQLKLPLSLDEFLKKQRDEEGRSIYVKTMQSEIISLENLLQRQEGQKKKRETQTQTQGSAVQADHKILLKKEEEDVSLFRTAVKVEVEAEAEVHQKDEEIISQRPKRKSNRKTVNKNTLDNKHIIDVVLKTEYVDGDEGEIVDVKSEIIEETLDQKIERKEHPYNIFNFYQEYYRPLYHNGLKTQTKEEGGNELPSTSTLFTDEFYYNFYSDMHTISSDETSPYSSNPRPYPFESFLVCKSLIELHGYPYRDGRESEKEKKTILEEDLRLEEGCHLRVHDVHQEGVSRTRKEAGKIKKKVKQEEEE